MAALLSSPAGAETSCDSSAAECALSRSAETNTVSTSLEGLRTTVLQIHADLVSAQDRIEKQLRERAGAASTRAGYLHTLVSQIGPPPDRNWKDEWVRLSVEHFRLTDATIEIPNKVTALISATDACSDLTCGLRSRMAR
jgi:hypothetical protein